ncbi:signal peptidase I [Nonomuraea sp. FMUSA5-5]|uniref:Signal peptidase I n=1 Tax=Nonomuraea composti TaxID=2720023 RepID=A0ABX1BFU6_9ACTN|nr:signal peptidase I [Nonomuraea sp. FMUSA5-5]NJP94624.1 signal peptidase I [Nonomuraea sp. FMUSA5-5]
MIRRRLRTLPLVLLLVAASGCGLADLALGGGTVTMPSESMEPTIKMGTTLSYRRTSAYVPHVGDIVLYRTPEGWPGTTAGEGRVGRVIGLPGGTVRCCDAEGRLELDGKPLDEPYVAAPPASAPAFDVKVPDGRLWIMNDNRHVALDSRAYQDAPGGGTIRVADVRGVVDLPAR